MGDSKYFFPLLYLIITFVIVCQYISVDSYSAVTRDYYSRNVTKQREFTRVNPSQQNWLLFPYYHYGKRLLQGKESRIKAENLVKENCDLAESKRDFNSFIYRGGSSTDGLLDFLHGGSDSSVLIDRVRNGPKKEDPSLFVSLISTGQGIFYTVLIVLATLFLIAVIIITPVTCSDYWRKNCSILFCNKLLTENDDPIQPIQSIEKSDVAYLSWCTLIFVVGIFGVIVSVGLAYASHLSKSFAGASCQTSRLVLEFQTGIKYEQKPDESTWLSGLPAGATFSGVEHGYMTYDRIEQEASPTNRSALMYFAKTAAASLGSQSGKSLASAKDLVNIVNSNEKDINEGAPNCNMITIIGTVLDSTEFKGLRTDIDTFKEKIEMTAKDVRSGLDAVQKSMEETAIDGRLAIDNLRQKVDQSNLVYPENPEEGLGSLLNKGKNSWYILFVVLFSFGLIGCLASLAACIYMRQLYKSSEEPPIQRAVYLFGGLWTWHAYMAAICLIVGLGVLSVVSFTGQMCDIAKSTGDDTKQIADWNMFPILQSNESARLLSECLNNDGKGNFIKALMPDLGSSASGKVTHVENLLKEDITETGRKMADMITPFVNAVSEIGTVIMIDIEKVLSKGDRDNFITIPVGYLLSGVTDQAYTFDVTLPAMKKLRETLNHASIESEDFADCLNGQAINPSYFETKLTISSFDTYTETFRAALKACLNTAVLPKFCVIGDPSCTSDPDMVVLDQSMASEDPVNDFELVVNIDQLATIELINSFKTSRHKLFEAKIAQPCKERLKNILQGPQSTERERAKRCALVLINNLYIGAHWISQGLRLREAMAKTRRVQSLPMGDQVNTEIGEQLKETLKEDSTALEDPLRAIRQFTEKMVTSDLNCKALAFSFGAVVDGLCGGVQGDLAWIGMLLVFAGLLSVFGIIIGLKMYQYFVNRLKSEGKLNSDENSSISPGSHRKENASTADGSLSPTEAFRQVRNGDPREVDRLITSPQLSKLKDKVRRDESLKTTETETFEKIYI